MRSDALKTFPFFKKTNKAFKGKKCQVFCGVRIITDEGLLGISETAVYLRKRKTYGRKMKQQS